MATEASRPCRCDHYHHGAVRIADAQLVDPSCDVTRWVVGDRREVSTVGEVVHGLPIGIK